MVSGPVNLLAESSVSKMPRGAPIKRNGSFLEPSSTRFCKSSEKKPSLRLRLRSLYIELLNFQSLLLHISQIPR